jgi:hypothetical protein
MSDQLLQDFAEYMRIELEGLQREGLVSEAVTAHTRELRRGFEAFDEAVASARTDQNLSEQGRQAAIATAKEQLLAHLDAFETTRLAPQVPAIEAVRAELAATVAPTPEPTPAEIAWVVAATQKYDITERGNLYLAADEKTRRAMELAPPVPRKEGTSFVWDPFVPADALENLRATRLRQLDPVLSKKLAVIERPHQSLAGLAKVGRGLVRKSSVR